MRSIRSRVLTLVLLPLLSLIGLYGFATALTSRDAITLARATALRNSVADPIGLFEAQVQTERLLATVYLAAPAAQSLAALTTQEAKTNRFLSTLRAAANSSSTTDNASSQVKGALAVLLTDVRQLPAIRQQISTSRVTLSQAQSAYTSIVTAGYNTIVQTILEMPNVQLEVQALTVMRVTQGLELLLQEQALFAGADMTRSFPASFHDAFAELVGEHRGIIANAMPILDPVYQSYYRQDVGPAASADLTQLENAVIDTPPGIVPRVPLTGFELVSGLVATALGNAGFRAGASLADYGRQVAGPVYLRLFLSGGLGLLAILVSIVASVLVGRSLVRELRALRSAALDLADVRLPLVVKRLSSGEDIGTDHEVPFPNPGPGEIGQVRQAFNSVQSTAIEAAAGQARLRAGIATVFRNLARRSQSLLHRQLAMLDDLELRAVQPDELESLFQLDHLTTRMRRHAEGLVVLAGDRPGRSWRKPVPLADVVRAAVAEVEDYRRVRVITRCRAALAGPAVADVIHLLAELIENATMFSPPNTPVRIIGDLVGKGFAVEIEDRGLGIERGAMDKLNAKLADPPQFDLAATEQLGLYVAARLAKEHRISITLRGSPFGGATAIVLMPADLVVSEESYSADTDASRANDLALKFTGRHAARSGLEDLPLPGGDRPPGEPGSNGGQNGRGSLATFTAPIGPVPEPTPGTVPAPGAPDARPQVPGPGIQQTGSKAPGAAPGGKENGSAQPDAQPDAGADPPATTEDLTELGLPRRIRQASLAPGLRDPQPPPAAGDGQGVTGGRSLDETRDAFTALQRGWERGRADSAAPAPGAWPSPPETGQQTGPGDDASPPPPRNSEQEDTT